jgi:hypothetical protein
MAGIPAPSFRPTLYLYVDVLDKVDRLSLEAAIRQYARNANSPIFTITLHLLIFSHTSAAFFVEMSAERKNHNSIQ